MSAAEHLEETHDDAATDDGGEPNATADQDEDSPGSEFADSDESADADSVALVDELGVDDLTDILFGSRGRIFSAAGRESPVAEFEADGVLLHPPHKPFQQQEQIAEEIVYSVDEHGILLNEFGERRKIVGAKYKGRPIYTLGETKPGTVKHFAAWFDDQWQPHKFYVQGECLTSDMLYRIRNRTHNGEISVFPEIETE